MERPRTVDSLLTELSVVFRSIHSLFFSRMWLPVEYHYIVVRYIATVFQNVIYKIWFFFSFSQPGLVIPNCLFKMNLSCGKLYLREPICEPQKASETVREVIQTPKLLTLKQEGRTAFGTWFVYPLKKNCLKKNFIIVFLTSSLCSFTFFYTS